MLNETHVPPIVAAADATAPATADTGEKTVDAAKQQGRAKAAQQ